MSDTTLNKYIDTKRQAQEHTHRGATRAGSKGSADPPPPEISGGFGDGARFGGGARFNIDHAF